MKEITKEFLHQELIVNNKPILHIANEIGISHSTIRNRIKKFGIKIPKRSNLVKNLEGKEFNYWTVLSRAENNKRGHAKWLCKCKCGKEKKIISSTLINGTSKSCGCLRKRLCYKGYKNINGVFWRKTIEGAKNRLLDFNLTIEEAWEILEKQNHKCALTGVPISLLTNNDRAAFQSASLDRINGELGYTKENIQWVHKHVNFLKGALTDEELLFWCREIYLNNKDRSDKIEEIGFRLWGKYEGTQNKKARYLPQKIRSNHQKIS